MNRKLMILSAAFLAFGAAAHARDQWTPSQAAEWQDRTGWLRGCNFIPSTAINELEMWQPESFDEATIDRELGYAEGIGFNSIRVFLHNLLWTQDADGFTKRVDKFLSIAAKHHIGVVLVLLDSCWDPQPKLGAQHAPTPHIHNSGWVQAPGVEILMHPERHEELKPYIQGIVGAFKGDKRIHAWDLFNEPDNGGGGNYAVPPNKADMALQLIRKEFAWAREMDPSQPLTSGPWVGTFGDPAQLSPMAAFQFDNSDIISFHNYGKLGELKECVDHLRRYQRPLICTEYMARPQGSTFDPNLGYLKEQKVGAYCWGFVSGKTQTIYPWDSWQKSYTGEPPLWFHDIFRPDGSPYDPKEVAYIKRLTGK